MSGYQDNRRKIAGLRETGSSGQITHHPGEALLLDYASGKLNGPFSLAIATHLTYCPACRETVAAFEAIGGALLAEMPDAVLGNTALDTALARLDEPTRPEHPIQKPRGILQQEWDHFPTPLRRLLSDEEKLHRRPVAWKSMLRGFDKIVLDSDDPGVKNRLLRFAGGWVAPRHKQTGIEMVVVLHGGFSDHFGSYGVGDVSVVEPQTNHQPVADPEGCLCLSAWEGPLKLTGAFGWALNPFIKL